MLELESVVRTCTYVVFDLFHYFVLEVIGM